MTSAVARLYALVLGITAFFVAWATVAAHPWAAPTQAARDPRLAALAARQARVQAESIRVKQIVDARWALYHRALAARNKAAATQAVSSAVAAPSVRVVTLPPLVVTRTS